MLQKLFLLPQECQRAFWQRLLLALARASYTLTGIDRSLITSKLVHIFSMKIKTQVQYEFDYETHFSLQKWLLQWTVGFI